MVCSTRPQDNGLMEFWLILLENAVVIEQAKNIG